MKKDFERRRHASENESKQRSICSTYKSDCIHVGALFDKKSSHIQQIIRCSPMKRSPAILINNYHSNVQKYFIFIQCISTSTPSIL